MENTTSRKTSITKKKLALVLIWAVAVISWLCLIGLGFTDPSFEIWLAAVTIVAVLTEIAFWSTALIFGVSLWESRKKVYAFLVSKK